MMISEPTPADNLQWGENVGNALNPTRPLDIRDGVLHYHLYDQEGVLRQSTCADTKSNQFFVVWCRKFDRR